MKNMNKFILFYVARYIMSEDLLLEIDKLKSSLKPIIVEGKKDKIALEKLGVKNIFTIKEPLFKLCEDLAKKNDSVIILTDLDKEGKKLYSKLKANLERNGVKVDDKFREYLFKETTLTQIEGIVKYIENKK